MGTLLHSYAKVCEPIELLLEAMSGVGRGMCLLQGAPRARRGRGISGILFPHCYRGVDRHFQVKCTKFSNVHTMESISWISTKFCAAVKTTKYMSSNMENKSKMEDGRHLEKLEKSRYV